MSYAGIGESGYKIVGKAVAVDLNTQGDQVIMLRTHNFIMKEVIFLNASGTVDKLTAGIYTDAGQGGKVIVSPQQAYGSLINPTDIISITGPFPSERRTDKAFFFNVATPIGKEATFDIFLLGFDLDS